MVRSDYRADGPVRSRERRNAGSVHSDRDDHRCRSRTIVGVDELIGAHAGRRLLRPRRSPGRLLRCIVTGRAGGSRAATARQPPTERRSAPRRCRRGRRDVAGERVLRHADRHGRATPRRRRVGSDRGDRTGASAWPATVSESATSHWVAVPRRTSTRSIESWVVGWDRSSTDVAPSGPPPIARALAGSAGPPFVGRSDVLNALSTEWTDAAVDTGRIVLIGGEAGTGKTRLAAELARRLHRPARRSCTERVTTIWRCPTSHGCRLSIPSCRSSSRRTGSWQRASHRSWRCCAAPNDSSASRPAAPATTPEAERYRRYSAFAQVLDAADVDVADAARTRRPALGGRADARAAASPAAPRAPSPTPDRRDVPGHG